MPEILWQRVRYFIVFSDLGESITEQINENRKRNRDFLVYLYSRFEHAVIKNHGNTNLLDRAADKVIERNDPGSEKFVEDNEIGM